MKHFLFSSAVLVALAACAPSDGTYLKRSEAKPDASFVLADGATSASVAERLRSLGFGVSSVAADTVRAAGRGGAFVDCGRITQYRDGNKSVYPGSTPLSVLYRSNDSQDFLTRQIAVLTRVTVNLVGNQATVRERHEITMAWSASDGSGTKQQSKAVTGGNTVTFDDGTVCSTGTLIADRLR